MVRTLPDITEGGVHSAVCSLYGEKLRRVVLPISGPRPPPHVTLPFKPGRHRRRRADRSTTLRRPRVCNPGLLSAPSVRQAPGHFPFEVGSQIFDDQLGSRSAEVMVIRVKYVIA